MMASSPKLLRIRGVFKHYDWGGFSFLPALMHRSNTDKIPYAEYWLGSNLHEGVEKVPYLFKVLDVSKMLSIQVHPDKASAVKKFEEENRKGVPLDAPYRNYKDDNHKPELLAPLSEFYLLHGFKSSDKMNKILSEVKELNFLIETFAGDNYRELYTRVMMMPEQEVNERLSPLLSVIIPAYQEGYYTKEQEHFWAARAALTFNTTHRIDRGIFSIYLFNIIKLMPGQALFQDAGLPHAYLEGQTMEIMANSDNVLRGGLTPKHIDVPELLQHVVYKPTIANVLQGDKTDTHEIIYPTSVKDFQLSRIDIRKDEGSSLPALSTDIYFIYQGRIKATADEETIELGSGETFAASPGSVVHFGAYEDAIIYRASKSAEN